MDKQIDRVYVGASSIVSSLGLTTQQCVESILAYKTNISMVDGTPACLIDIKSFGASMCGDYTHAERLVISALEQTQQSSGVALNHNRTAILISSTKGSVDCLAKDFERSYLWMMANKVADYFGCVNTPKVISTACISGVAALAFGSRMIEQAQADNVYVVGVDTISEFILEGFKSFKSISQTICRPYDAARDGLTAGEGCGVMLLTNDREKSPERIVVGGSGISNDANHISAPSRAGEGLALAIRQTLHKAQLSCQDIDYVNLHGTGTLFNDEMESRVMDLMNLRDVACNSLKPYFGHTFGASGVIESILTVYQLSHNIVFGTKGYQQCGVPFELNVSAQHRQVPIRHALKTASGFGGTNAALLFSKESYLPELYKIEQIDVTIKELARISLDSSQIDTPFAEYIKGEYRALGEPNLKFFKMDELSKLGYIASCKLLEGISLDLPSSRVGVVLANRSSSSQSDLKHQQMVDLKLAEGASPAIFVYTLPNIVASEIAIKHKFQGESLFFVQEHRSLEIVGNYAHQLIQDGVCDAFIYGWCELLGEKFEVELILIKKI